MDAYKSRYASETYTMCGIPSITLLGSESDWQRMVELAITVIDAIHALQPITLGVGRLMRAERPLDAGAWLFVCPAHNFCVACGASTTWSHELCQRCKSQRGPQASVCLHARACRFIIYIHTHTILTVGLPTAAATRLCSQRGSSPRRRTCFAHFVMAARPTLQR